MHWKEEDVFGGDGLRSLQEEGHRTSDCNFEMSRRTMANPDANRAEYARAAFARYSKSVDGMDGAAFW
jgi:hypothetical protein